MRTHCVIMTQGTWTPPPRFPSINFISRFSKKLIIFQKRILNVFRIKKVNFIFEELSSLYLIVLVISYFLFSFGLQQKNRTNLKELFIWTTKSGWIQHHKHTDHTWLFISNCSNVNDILYWRFLHYFWLQELIQHQTLT